MWHSWPVSAPGIELLPGICCETGQMTRSEQWKQAKEYENLGIDFFSCYKNEIEDCINCESTFQETFLKLLSMIKIKPEWNFMDCGSGLGLPLYLASSYFKKVYGVEIIEEIANISIKNLNILKVENFEVVCSDINKIDDNILDTINVFYLFNPFINVIFKNFILKIINSIKRNDRDVIIIYVNATQENLIEKYQNDLFTIKSINDFRKINFYSHEKDTLK